MANWQTGASFANSFLNTIQGLTALQNAQMQNARLARDLQQEVGYETAVAEESGKAKGLDLGKISEGLKFQDIKYDTGETTTADQQRQAWQQAIPEIQKLPPEQQQQVINALGQTELGQGLGLEKLKTYQTAGGETRFNQLGREALPSDINRSVMQRMRETGNIAGQERALKMGKLSREDEAAQAEMDFSNWLTEQTKLIQTDPTKWVQENLAGYNKPGKGSFLNDGMTGKVVMSADGKTSSFVQMDKKGKTISSTPITAETAMQGLQAMAFDKYKAMPGKFKEAFTMGIEQEKLGETKRHNRAVEGIYVGKFGSAGGGTKTAKQMKEDAAELFKGGVANPLNGNKPFASKEEAYNTLVQIKSGLAGPKVRNPYEEKAYEAYLKAVPELGPKASDADRAALAKQYGVGHLLSVAPDKYASVLGGKDVDTTRPGAAPAAATAAAPQQAIPVAKPDLSKWTMKPAGKTLFGETDYVLEGPTGRMSLSDFIDRYGYNPTAEFIGRR